MRKKKFKIWPALLFCTLVLVLMPATAVQAKQKNKGKIGKSAKWSYNEKKKVLTISGKGNVKASDLKKEDKSGESLWLGREDGNLPMFQRIVFEEGITTIDYAFFCLENVKTISLPKSFKSIQYSYIDTLRINGQLDPWSTTLKKIVVHKKNKKFKVSKGVLLSKNGRKLYVFPVSKRKTVYKIPNKITEIGPYAFWGADIQKVTIGNKVTKIGSYAFHNSTLKELTFGKKVKRIGYAAFKNCTISQLQLPESLMYIDRYAFCKCPVTEITIPSKVARIRNNAFSNNHKLKKIVLQGNAVMEGSPFWSTVSYYRYKDNKSIHIELPITVVLGKNVKVNIKNICYQLGSKITFQVESGNIKYYVTDGNLYTIRGNQLVYERKKEDAKIPPANTATGSAVQI